MPDTSTSILVVEDCPITRKTIRTCLHKMGYDNVELAEDGAIGWNLMRARKFDLVITDWHMPNLSGLELIQSIRREPAFKSTRILMLTAESDKENVVQAIRIGINGYVVKPFALGILEQKIRSIIQ